MAPESASGRLNWEWSKNMNAARIAGIVLVVAGAFGLAYGQFSYTKDTHRTTVGPIELSVKDRETVAVPTWLCAGAIVLGGLLAFGIIGKR
jgi:hypothetical protein